jgi:ubiquinone/menaquinone biosynthesis C-methylase UbiE
MTQSFDVSINLVYRSCYLWDVASFPASLVKGDVELVAVQECTGWPSEVLPNIEDQVSIIADLDDLDSFYIGRTNDLDEALFSHDCDEVFPLYEAMNVRHAREVEAEMVDIFFDHPKCENQHAPVPGGSFEGDVNHVYMAVWYQHHQQKRLTKPYGALESWVYDRIVMPAMAEVQAAVLEVVLDALPKGTVRALDVGCGGGQTEVGLLSRRPDDLELAALDPSRRLIDYSRKRTAQYEGKTVCVRGTAHDLPFGDGCFDCVFSIASIKHWADPGRGLRECVRVLAPGGSLLVFEADRGCPEEEIQRFVGALRIVKPLARRMFRSQVANRSFDSHELGAFASPLSGMIDIVELSTLDQTPLLILRGRKR